MGIKIGIFKRPALDRKFLVKCGIIAAAIAIITMLIAPIWQEISFRMSEKRRLTQRFIELEANRGMILNEEGEVLTANKTVFDLYLDFTTPKLLADNARLFWEHLDATSNGLSKILDDRSRAEYDSILRAGFESQKKYYRLKKNVSYEQYLQIRSLSLPKLGQYASGFIFEPKRRRHHPFGILAARTLGRSIEFTDSDGKIRNSNIGLENTYDSVLRGESGKALVTMTGGGNYEVMHKYEIPKEHGRDIVTTLDMFVQHTAYNALRKGMNEMQAQQGCAIVMETKTGKIRAIANLGRSTKDNQLYEDMNYAILPIEPGNLFSVINRIALLEENSTLEQRLNVALGAKGFSLNPLSANEYSLTRALKNSSNSAGDEDDLSKLIRQTFSKEPSKYINRLKDLKVDQPTGIDIVGEKPLILNKQFSERWTTSDIVHFASGKDIRLTPVYLLTLYNALANGGKMMKPYIVSAIRNQGKPEKNIRPVVVKDSVCSNKTLKILKNTPQKELLFNRDGAYLMPGTASKGETENWTGGYGIQLSFVGSFPNIDPLFSCIVIMFGNSNSLQTYISTSAASVFAEISETLVRTHCQETIRSPEADTTITVDYPMDTTGIPPADSTVSK